MAKTGEGKPLKIINKKMIHPMPPKDLLIVRQFDINWELAGAWEDMGLALKSSKLVMSYKGKLRDKLNELTKQLEDLQQQEKKGINNKAYDSANKLVKKANSDIEDDLEDIKDEIRGMYQKAAKKAAKGAKSKGNIVFVSRSRFYEMKLARGAFSGGAEDEKFQSLMQNVAKGLAELGKESIKLGRKEAQVRDSMLDSLEKYEEIVDPNKKRTPQKTKSSEGKEESGKEVYKSERKTIRSAEESIDAYSEHLKAWTTKLEQAAKHTSTLENDLKKQKDMQDGKKAKKLVTSIDSSLQDLINSLQDRQKLASQMEKIMDGLKADRFNLKEFQSAQADLLKLKDIKEASELQKHTKKLEGMSK